MYKYYSRSSNTFHDFFGQKKLHHIIQGPTAISFVFWNQFRTIWFFYMHFFKKYHIAETHKTGNFFFQKMF